MEVHAVSLGGSLPTASRASAEREHRETREERHVRSALHSKPVDGVWEGGHGDDGGELEGGGSSCIAVQNCTGAQDAAKRIGEKEEEEGEEEDEDEQELDDFYHPADACDVYEKLAENDMTLRAALFPPKITLVRALTRRGEGMAVQRDYGTKQEEEGDVNKTLVVLCP